MIILGDVHRHVTSIWVAGNILLKSEFLIKINKTCQHMRTHHRSSNRSFSNIKLTITFIL